MQRHKWQLTSKSLEFIESAVERVLIKVISFKKFHIYTDWRNFRSGKKYIKRKLKMPLPQT